eukprot:TRINITY_DN50774_c0_g1_i1.p1 TRINITY_DN50774_c0_g1~~TRINITY_DN50774_c0_g1_i1.p1  ORF type:complete len:790 (+),score=201.72 TRINITY_DN50774_c0_g1_i1:72-2372(+)
MGVRGVLAVVAALHCGVSAAPAVKPWLNSTLPRDERVSALLRAMTPQEKVAQLGTDTPRIDRLAVPAYHWRNNVLHGTVDNGVSTQFPQAIAMAATFDPEWLRRAARVMADEQRAKHNVKLQETGGDSPMDYGLDLWGPNINLFRDPRWGRGQETYGEDPVLTARLLEGFVSGLQDGPQRNNTLGERLYETLATCKHFAAYSIEDGRLSFDPNISATDLWQYYFPAWESCAQRAASVMCAYSGLDGFPMCMSPLVNTVLRAQLTFGRARPEAYVVTDSGAVDFMVSQFHRFNSTEEAAAAAFNAGMDLNSGSAFQHQLGAALSKGLVTAARVDEALGRLLHARMALGLFDPPASVVYSRLGAADVLSPAHSATALEVARRAAVLLRNAGGLLPVRPASVRRVAVIGWAANDTYVTLGNYMGCGYGAWTPRLPNCSIVTPLEGVRRAFPAADVAFARGCDVESADTSGFAAAVTAAAAADLVLFVGGNRNCEGGQGKGGAHCESEGHDRPDLAMPGVQTELLQKVVAANPRTVLAVTTGGPIAMNWEAANVAAIIVIWYGGQQMGTALGEFLTGEVSPSGRLPMTWPSGIDQLPPARDMSPSTPPGRTYRHLSAEPLYSFGYGLSYGAVSYADASVAPEAVSSAAGGGTLQVCANVSNAGSARATEEVVQVYAVPQEDVVGAAVPRAVLLAVSRTAAIPPGETVRVCATVGLAALRLMARGGSGPADFRLLAGTYRISVGGAPPGALGTGAPPAAVAPPQFATLRVS